MRDGFFKNPFFLNPANRMSKAGKTAILFLLFCGLFTSVTGQDSTGGLSAPWQVESKKIDASRYELKFTAPVKPGWEIFAPAQKVLDLKTTELRFRDSSILLEGEILPGPSSRSTVNILFGEAPVSIYDTEASWTAVINIPGTIPARLQGTLLYTYGDGENGFYPSTVSDFQVALEGGVESTARIKIPSINIKAPVNDCGDDLSEGKSLIEIFLLGLLGGLIALLTPCVFPMVPVTVSFFTKQSESKGRGVFNASMYGFFIFLIYVLITLPFHLASKTISPEIFNNISTNVWLNLIFFAVFIVFAISFFGYFEIGLPSSLANKMGSKSGAGDIPGIFFMAGTLVIVSFSCTGPILGTLLAGVAEQGAWPLTVGAAGFGLALGLPFALFGMFPRWLQSLPRSGGWMTNVKVVLGFVELALAIKFFSNADLVKQWGLLKREVFIALWLLITICTIIYLLGWLRFPHSTRIKKFSFTRIAFIALFLAFAVYLAPGLTNTKAANLKWISGFPPPLCYSIYPNPVNCKTGFKPLEDYEEALAKAKKENKPVLIDFTGWACVNCRKMEESVWTDPTVDSLMHKEFVVVSLYVDEKRRLELVDQILFKTSSGSEKSIVSVGDKWSTFQTENFYANAQPQYAIISPDEIALTKTKFYTPSPSKFSQWLLCGLEAFRKGPKSEDRGPKL
jgi:cytochrome c biogenesis protein CcdA/thioredoxin-related protein